jgi:site-specific DNA recombinase
MRLLRPSQFQGTQRTGYSLSAQSDLIEAYAGKKELQVVHRYSEVHSAKAPGRPRFGDMVEYLIREQSKANPCRIILVEKTDRLYRNLIDAATLIALDVEIHLVKENTVISRNDGPSESLAHGMNLLIAKFYTDNLAAETKKGMRKKVHQGGWPHIAPIGYQNITGTDDKGAIVPDEARAHHVRELFRMYATGRWSLEALRRQIILDGFTTKKGNKPTKSLVHQILTNPIYYGDMFWKGKVWPGKHQPLIDKALFEQVQAGLEGKRTSSTGTRKIRWPFQGLIKCGHCACSMVAEAHKGHTYYHRSGARGRCPEIRWAKQPEISAAFQEALSLIAFDQVHVDWAVQSLRETHKDRFACQEKRERELEREQVRLERKLNDASRYLLDKVLNEEQYL